MQDFPKVQLDLFISERLLRKKSLSRAKSGATQRLVKSVPRRVR